MEANWYCRGAGEDWQARRRGDFQKKDKRVKAIAIARGGLSGPERRGILPIGNFAVGAPMNASLTPLDSILLTIVLATLAVGLPVVLVMSIRLLWDRNVNLGRSKELDKLIWQLHRIASAQEHQLNLSFPAVQPGTEEARDLAFLQPLAQPAAAARSVAAPSANATAPVARPVEVAAVAQPTAAQSSPVAAVPQASAPAVTPPQSPAETQRHGVNSMFGL